MKLNLGCGEHICNGFIGVDTLPLTNVDVVADLATFPWPFKDNVIQEIIMYNILEHLSETIKVMEEVWRILVHNGIVNIIVPYYNSPGAFMDPTHVRFFTENSFDYFTENYSPLSRYNYYTHSRFDILLIKFCQRSFLNALPSRIQVFLAHHFATVHGLEVKLRAIK